MEPEEREMLQRLLKLSEQNNRILRSMKRSVTIGRLMHMVYWIIIIAITVISYYYMRPYIETIKSTLGAVDQLQNIRY